MKSQHTVSDEEESRVSLSSYSQVVHGERERKQDEPSFFFKVPTTYRQLSFCIFFILNLLWLLLTIALALGGYSPINDEHIGEVGLEIPDDPYQQRANAYQRARDAADYSLTPAKCKRESAANRIELIVMKGRFEKENNGNALSKEGLELLQEREQYILQKSGWENRCALVYLETFPTCQVAKEIYATNGNVTYLASSVDGCMLPYSPVFLFNKYGDSNFNDIPGTVAKIRASPDWLSFKDMLHKDFDEFNLESKILVSGIYAGTPRHEVERYTTDEEVARIYQGFSISYYNSKDEEKELDHLTNWIEDNLLSEFEQNFDNKPFRTLYYYPGYNPVDSQVTTDLTLIFISILFVILYMNFYTGSLFITACGIFQIFMSFLGANILYRYCWPTENGLGYNYFTLFCALALFIIMGIGADDIFVYWDTWSGSMTHYYKTTAHRFAHCYQHAASAMGVTSLTTILAFLSNLGSPFIGIRTFGIFSAILVAVNYLAVITFFPVVVLMYDKFFQHKQYWCTPCVNRCCAAIRRKLPKKIAYDQNIENGGAPMSAELNTKIESAKNKLIGSSSSDNDYEEFLPRWFRDKYTPFLLKRRKLIIAILVAMWAVFLGFATQLEAVPFKLYELLPETQNFHQVIFVQEEWKTRTSNPLQVHLLFGLDHRQPLNLHGTRPKNFVSGETGTPEWDNRFDLDEISAQLQMIRVAEEFAINPRSGLKIDNQEGINRQIVDSRTGSLEDTIDGGASSSVQGAYGIQSLFHALQTWENVSIAADSDTGEYIKVIEHSCIPCWNTFKIEPNPFDLDRGYIDPELGTVIDALIINATSNLNNDCNCYGFFPIASDVCLYETRASSTETLLKCSESNDNVAEQIGNFLSSGFTSVDEQWWTDYIFAIGDSYGRFTRIAMYDIQVMTVLSASESDFKKGLRMAKKFDDWMDDHNSDSQNPLRVLVYVPGAEEWKVSSILVPSGIQNLLLSLALAFVVLLLASGNYITATIATITIGMICTCVLGFIQILGWGLGAIESVLIVIVVGFSVDYTVHLADSYMASKSLTREGKTLDALVHTGQSVLSGAISTLGASLPMFGAQIIFFSKIWYIHFSYHCFIFNIFAWFLCCCHANYWPPGHFWYSY
mmetsp:Transcript_13990/g.17448  ORF Transcript_13990/g.17448 Transcript_13990/m.17448 type:complete len:1123 (+) Transcript_13990:72-3440(+)